MTERLSQLGRSKGVDAPNRLNEDATTQPSPVPSDPSLPASRRLRRYSGKTPTLLHALTGRRAHRHTSADTPIPPYYSAPPQGEWAPGPDRLVPERRRRKTQDQ